MTPGRLVRAVASQRRDIPPLLLLHRRIDVCYCHPVMIEAEAWRAGGMAPRR
jgi:hypothetical protein